MATSMVHIFKVFFFFTAFFCATFLTGDSRIRKVYAFTCITSCPTRAQKVEQELGELKSAGINTYIYWQYSGSCSNPWADSNDPYSFFQGDPLCEVFKRASANGMTIGVNAHHLSTHIGETDQLAYLKSCGVSIIRFWAYPNIGSGASTARATVDAITSAGMRAIPVICDYSNTCTELGITGTTQSDPTNWYQSGYKGAYKTYALQLKNALSGASLFGIELLNEPHCGGQAGCVQPYTSWASDMVGVLGGTVGIGQKASENTTRGDSPGVGNPQSDFTKSNASVGMASAHYYNPPEKALALEAGSQASALGKTFYIGERGLTCEGVEGEAPGGSGQTRPSCTAGEYNLTIKGTVKSSEVFATVEDRTSGKTTLINRNSIPRDQWVNYSFINNQPVKGAVVAIYPSYAFTGGDNYGNQVAFSPGKMGGKLHTNKINYKKVGSDGNFELTTTNTCDEVWQYGGWKQYLVVMCPEKRNGVTTPVVKDLYAFPLNKTNGEVTLTDIDVPCDADLSGVGSVLVPPDLEYMVRDPKNFLACGAASTFPSTTTTYKSERWDNPLLFKDYIAVKLPWPLSGFSNIVQHLLDLLMKYKSFAGSREGFIGVQQASCDIRSQYSSPVEFYGGVKSDYVDLPKYYIDGTTAVDTYNGNEEKLPLPLCTQVRDCNNAVSFNGEANNMQTCGGMANNLRAPFDNTTANSIGEIVPDELGYAARYRSTNKNMEICKDTNAPGSSRHFLYEVAPPEGICGDSNLNKKIDAGIEMPCPTDPNCGDQNNDGSIVFPETVCSSGSGAIYKFDSRYFPYNQLYTRTTEPKGNYIEIREKSGNDGVSRCLEGGRDTPFSATEGTRPNNNCGPEGSKFPEGYGQIKMPATIYGTDATRRDYGGDSNSIHNPASLVLTEPLNFTGEANINTIRSALVDLSSKISYNPTTTFYKIGVPDNLCSCSTVENGNNSTKTCISVEKAAVKTEQPLNLFTNLWDWDIWGNGYTDMLGRVHTYQPGYKFAGDTRADSVLISPTMFKTYYKQNMNAAFELINGLAEMVGNVLTNCHDDGISTETNELGIPVEYAKGNCVRKLAQISYNYTMCPWCPDMSETKNALHSMESFNQPFFQEARIVNTCEIDAGQSKSLDPAMNYGLGQEWVWAKESDSVDLSATFMRNSVSSPSFGGFTNQCSMVPGWNVTEYAGKGLFATDCTSDTSKCWVTGAFDHEDWQHTNSTLVLESTNQGSSWNASVSSLGNFLHGLGIGGEKIMSVGQGGSVYNISQNSFTNVVGYPKYLYDVAGSVGVGYFAGGTSEAAYSKNGSLWKTLNIKDGSPESYAYGRPGVGCGADDNGDYGPYYPRGCVPYNYQEGGVPANCGEPGLPQCCCEDDADTHTPACTGCWGWNYNSIWGADCNSFGDCMMTGDGVWSARKQEMLACSNKPVERDMRNCMTDVWWKNKKPKLNYCTGPGKVGNCLTWSAAYPGKDIAYISLGGRADVYYARTDPEKGKGDGGGGIVKSVKSTDGGLDWVQQAIPAGLVTSLRGIDCFSETDCVAVGTNGVILRTTNGTTWEEYWKDSQEIKDAKTTNVQFLGVAYPNKNTVIAVGYIPKPPDGAVDKGVIYTLGEKEVCTEPPDEPDDPGEPGDPDNPGDPGNPEAYCNDGCQTCWSLQISADRGGFTVTNPGEGTWGDLHIQWKNNGNGNRYQIPGKETGRNTIRIDNPGCGDWEFDSRASGCQDQSRPGGNVPC